jgi:glutamyl-tRNA reductase
MHYLIISYSHKNCDIVTREKLSISDENKLHEFYKNIHKCQNINESVVLSTCNRVEIILSVNERPKVRDYVLKLISDYSKVEFDELESRADIYEDNAAIHHLFSVASSLDSLVVGETQITGQLKDAFKFAKNYEYSKVKLAKLINYSFRCAATIRNETTISSNPVSIASTAVSYANDLVGDLGGMSALVVGAGEMGRLATKNLHKKGCNIIVINRDIKKAQILADEFDEGVSVKPYEELSSLINRYKLLFSATSAPYTIINKNMVEAKEYKRYWFDLAVPRDIDEMSVDGLYTYSVDDLQVIVSKNRELREAQAKIAYKIITQHVTDYITLLDRMGIDPAIKMMRLKANECIEDELSKAIKKGFITKQMEANVRKTLQNSFNKFLHSPTKKLKSITNTHTADRVVESFDMLFKD